MAISVSYFLSGTGGATTVTTSLTTTTGRLYLAALTSSSSTTPTISNGLGLTWTLVGTPITVSSNSFVIYSAICGAGATGTLTVTGHILGTGYFLNEVTGASTFAPIVQNVQTPSAVSTSPINLTLGSFSRANNGTYLIAFINTNSGSLPTSITPKTGWTLINPSFGPSYNLASEFIATNDTTPSLAWTGGSFNNAVGMAMEIAIDVPPTSTTIKNSLMLTGVGI